MAMATPAMARTSTPRPSISPLSTTSKPAKGSPIATRDAIMDNTEAIDSAKAHSTIVDTTADTAVMDDDDGSSSLSDPDEEVEDSDSLLYTSGNNNGPTRLLAQKSVEVDSEAETERLEETPQKLRKHADSIGRTPSKLKEAARVDEELSEPPSPLPMDAGAASSTSTIATGAKRKLSDRDESPLTSEDSELGESPRKRRTESPATTALGPQKQDAEVNGGQDLAAADTVVEPEAVADPDHETPTVPMSKGAKGKKGKQKGRRLKEQVPTLSNADTTADSLGADLAREEETAQKLERDLISKRRAASPFDRVARTYQTARKDLLEAKVAAVEEELRLLKQPVCTHPEYLRQVACLDERRAKQQREAHAFRVYRTHATIERTLGERAQLHSQYFQQVREQREEVLGQLGEEWYSIQKERRTQHQENDERYMYRFPSKKSAQVRQAGQYNQEVSVLSGMAKYRGFPAAPEISGVAGSGLDDDLKAMKLSRRVPQPGPHTHQHHQQIQQQQSQQQMQSQQTLAQPTTAYSERRAHEQFLEQNAWARPIQAVPNYGTPNLTHTTDWVDQPTGGPRRLMRNMSGQGSASQFASRQASPYATPMPVKQQPSYPSEQHPPSDGPELPSSVLAAPPTGGRMLQDGQNVFASSPLQVAKHRNNNGLPNGTSSAQRAPPYHLFPQQQQQQQAVERADLTGFRNISGASTIDAPLSAEKAGPSPGNNYHHSALPNIDNASYETPSTVRPPPPRFAEKEGGEGRYEPSAPSLHGHPSFVEKDASNNFRPAESAFAKQ